MPSHGETRINDGHLETYYEPPGVWQRSGHMHDRGEGEDTPAWVAKDARKVEGAEAQAVYGED